LIFEGFAPQASGALLITARLHAVSAGWRG